MLVGGIRSAESVSFEQKIMTLLVNSLLETNLGAVPIFCIYVAVTARYTEELKKRDPVKFFERIAEINRTKVRESA